MIDLLTLATLDKSKPLRIVESTSTRACAICDGPIGPEPEWVVKIPGHGQAHPNCAVDHHWECV